MIQIVRTSDFAVRKLFSERTVIAEARRDVTPLRKQRLIRRAPRHIAAHGHRPQCAAMIALPPRNHAITRGLPAFEVKLPRQLDRGFCGFGPARSEINSPAAKTRRSQLE